MFKIKKLKILVIDETDVQWSTEISFLDNITAIIGKNTLGKSTIINSIYYVLGLEELLGYRGSKALKPALTESIKDDFQNKYNVKFSKVYLEIENQDLEKIELSRIGKGKNNEETNIIFTKTKDGNYKKYYLKRGSAIHEKGFYYFLENFLKIKLPEVLSYDNKKIKLYLQNIFSEFFIEQIGGWSDFLACIPKYYKIKNPKQRSIEYLLGLKVNDIILKKMKLENDKKLKLEKISESIIKINFLKNKNFIVLEGLEEEYKKFDYNKVRFFIRKDSQNIILLKDYLEEKIEKLEKIKKSNCESLEDPLDANKILFEKINKIQQKLILLQGSEMKFKSDRLSLNLQIKEIKNSGIKVKSEKIALKEIEKINKVGEKEKINFNECPYCGNKTSGDLYDLPIKHMSIKENLKFLDEKEKVLDITASIIENKIKIVSENIEEMEIKKKRYRNQLNDLSVEIPKLAIKKDNYKKEFLISLELEEINETKSRIQKNLLIIKNLSEKIKIIDKELEIIPKDFLSQEDKNILKTFEKDLIEIYKEFELEGENAEIISVSREKYFPEIEKFDVRLHISASDFIRLEWAFYLALLKNSIFKQNILIFDEPSQQNVNYASVKKLFLELKKLKNTQSIVSYAIDEDKKDDLISFFKENSINYKLFDSNSIKKDIN